MSHIPYYGEEDSTVVSVSSDKRSTIFSRLRKYLTKFYDKKAGN